MLLFTLPYMQKRCGLILTDSPRGPRGPIPPLGPGCPGSPYICRDTENETQTGIIKDSNTMLGLELQVKYLFKLSGSFYRFNCFFRSRSDLEVQPFFSYSTFMFAQIYISNIYIK